METFGDGTQAGKRSGGQGGDPRPGQSGEGARSVMEQLIQQEKKRDAQLPRDPGGEGAPVAVPRP
jgi:hypothetical protein